MAQLKLRSPPGVLRKILCQKQVDVMARSAMVSTDELQERADSADAPRDLAAALLADGFGLIAEFKPKSPSQGKIRDGADPVEIAGIYTRYASAISCLTDLSFFGSDHENLTKIRAAVSQPVICKDFLVSEYQVLEARAYGADAVLLMASLLTPKSMHIMLEYVHELGMQALVEVHSDAELDAVVRLQPKIIGVNTRDLTTMKISLEPAKHLLNRIPKGTARVVESGLTSAAAINMFHASAHAALIGTAIMSAKNPEAKIRELGWSGHAN